MPTIDWSQVKVPEVKDTRIWVGKLSQLDYAKFLVASKIMNRSLSANGQSALTAYVRKNWAEHEEILIVEAIQKGLTPEEYLTKILSESS